MNLEVLGGISKSDFSLTAIMPKIKNRKAGFVILEINRLIFITSKNRNLQKIDKI